MLKIHFYITPFLLLVSLLWILSLYILYSSNTLLKLLLYIQKSFIVVIFMRVGEGEGKRERERKGRECLFLFTAFVSFHFFLSIQVTICYYFVTPVYLYLHLFSLCCHCQIYHISICYSPNS